MKRSEKLLMFLAGFLIAVGLLLNLNVAMAQARVTGVTALDPTPGSDPAAPASPFGSVAYQGRLTSGGGTPVDSPVQLVFRLYGDDDSTVLWTGSPIPVTPVNGLFTVSLSPTFGPPLGETWADVAYIGVQVVGESTEMTPHQPLGTVVGHGIMGGTAVVAGSPSGSAVNASSGGTAVVANSVSGSGVYAINNNVFAPAVRARNNVKGGPAITLSGGIQVEGAGVDTETAVFTHKVVTSTVGSTMCGSSESKSVIDNPYTTGHPDAILIVTPNYGPSDTGVAPGRGIPGVFYDATSECGSGPGKWVIYYIEESPPAMVNNSLFNVMVIRGQNTQ